MAWTTTTDVSAGSVLTASTFNDQVLGNLNELRGDYATSRYSTADITLNSTTWANLGGPADLVLAASAGDLVEVAFSGHIASAAVNVNLDVVTIVSSTATNSFGSNGAISASHLGILAWYCPTSAVHPIGGSYFYKLVAGDISSATVTLRLRYKTSTATPRTLFAAADYPLVFFARNHGPVEI